MNYLIIIMFIAIIIGVIIEIIFKYKLSKIKNGKVYNIKEYYKLICEDFYLREPIITIKKMKNQGVYYNEDETIFLNEAENANLKEVVISFHEMAHHYQNVNKEKKYCEFVKNYENSKNLIINLIVVYIAMFVFKFISQQIALCITVSTLLFFIQGAKYKLIIETKCEMDADNKALMFINKYIPDVHCKVKKLFILRRVNEIYKQLLLIITYLLCIIMMIISR